MDKQEFIKKIAGYVKKYASDYGIAVHSPIIAQAILVLWSSFFVTLRAKKILL